MSDSVQPQRQQPTRLLHPRDSPGKNTGVGCHFLLQCMKVKSESEVSVVSDSLRPHGLQPTRLLHPWDFPGKSTRVGCYCLKNPLILALQPCLPTFPTPCPAATLTCHHFLVASTMLHFPIILPIFTPLPGKLSILPPPDSGQVSYFHEAF